MFGRRSRRELVTNPSHSTWTAAPPGILTEQELERIRQAKELSRTFDGYLLVSTLSTELQLEFQGYNRTAINDMTPRIAYAGAYHDFMYDRTRNTTARFDNVFNFLYAQEQKWADAQNKLESK
jgi:hypothetical protein